MELEENSTIQSSVPSGKSVSSTCVPWIFGAVRQAEGYDEEVYGIVMLVLFMLPFVFGIIMVVYEAFLPIQV